MEKLKTFDELLDYLENEAPSEQDLDKRPLSTETFVVGNVINELYTAGYDLNSIAQKLEDNGREFIRYILNTDIILRAHPDAVDCKKFWTVLRTKYPNITIYNNSSSMSVDELNLNSWKFSQSMGLTTPLIGYIRDYYLINKHIKNITTPNVFEIGYGEGAVYENIKKWTSYNGIDFVKPRKYPDNPRFIVIEKSGIPEYVPDNSQDVLIASNTFQHVSRAQREEYYEQAYRILKPDGLFLFFNLMTTPTNVKQPYFQYADEHGVMYSTFFNQLVEIDELQDVITMLELQGFDVQYEERTPTIFKFTNRARK